jgi:PIF1-like helicase/Helicase
MTTTLEKLQLDPDNPEFNYAADFIRHTDKLVYLTGKAGTGKTTFLKYLKETTDKNIVVLAPTGVAAINAGGQTIHSFFQIPPSVFVPGDKRLRMKADFGDMDKSTVYEHFRYSKEKLAIMRKMDLLVIDEISMVRCDLLDVIDSLLRAFRRANFLPFGGVQVLLIGDTFQLPPIAAADQWDILKSYYDSEFFFSARAIQEAKPIYIELKKIYRQKEQAFIDLLNRVRINQITERELTLLNSKFNPRFSTDENANYIILATHNQQVNSVNLTKLAALDTPLYVFEAQIDGIFPDNTLPTEKTLQLKEGAQVMFVKNDPSKGYHNGKIAKVVTITDEELVVEVDGGEELLVEKQVWKNIRYAWNEAEQKVEEETIGTFTQFPLRLAWAITVHKSQGLTFEKVVADLGGAFAPGQVYVALSRCTSFQGLVLKTTIGASAIKTDPRVLQFAQEETPNTLIVAELNDGKANFYYKKAREFFRALDIENAFENLSMALIFRNDIGTDIFKRYIVAHGSRLARDKKLFAKAAKRFTQLTIQNQELKAEVAALRNPKAKPIMLDDPLLAENERLLKRIDTVHAQKASLAKKVADQKKEIKALLAKLGQQA